MRSGGIWRIQLVKYRIRHQQAKFVDKIIKQVLWIVHQHIICLHITSSTTPVFLVSTGVRWSTQLLILTNLWWGAMCSHYYLLTTTLDQDVQCSNLKTMKHVLIWLNSLKVHQNLNQLQLLIFQEHTQHHKFLMVSSFINIRLLIQGLLQQSKVWNRFKLNICIVLVKLFNSLLSQYNYGCTIVHMYIAHNAHRDMCIIAVDKTL